MITAFGIEGTSMIEPQPSDVNSLRIHELKIWPAYFKAVVEGHKTFEHRKDDRGYQVGDWLLLHEFDPVSETYVLEEGTGIIRMVAARVTYILALPDNTVIMSIVTAHRSW